MKLSYFLPTNLPIVQKFLPLLQQKSQVLRHLWKPMLLVGIGLHVLILNLPHTSPAPEIAPEEILDEELTITSLVSTGKPKPKSDKPKAEAKEKEEKEDKPAKSKPKPEPEEADDKPAKSKPEPEEPEPKLERAAPPPPEREAPPPPPPEELEKEEPPPEEPEKEEPEKEELEKKEPPPEEPEKKEPPPEEPEGDPTEAGTGVIAAIRPKVLAKVMESSNEPAAVQAFIDSIPIDLVASSQRPNFFDGNDLKAESLGSLAIQQSSPSSTFADYIEPALNSAGVENIEPLEDYGGAKLYRAKAGNVEFYISLVKLGGGGSTLVIVWGKNPSEL
jgi:hypothetical protein